MADTVVRKSDLGGKVARKLEPLVREALALCPPDYAGEISLTATVQVSQGGATCVTLETLGAKQRSRR
jgi:hypothetical protein